MKAFEVFYCAIHGHPRHHFRMCELLTFSLYFPYSLIGLHPNFLEMVYPLSFYGSASFRHTRCALSRLMHRVGNFAVDIQLELSGSRVADAYRFRVLVTG